jgi:hypothetical protein
MEMGINFARTTHRSVDRLPPLYDGHIRKEKVTMPAFSSEEAQVILLKDFFEFINLVNL